MKKKIMMSFLSLIGIVIIAGGAYAYYIYNSAKAAADKMHETVKSTSITTTASSQNGQPISILLLGVDQRKNDPGRSDTIIVMTLNPKKGTTQMISIPRDTRALIAGRGTMDKINAAYAYGGTEMALETVENFTGMQMDYYVRVNMKALKELVDAVGGITVNNTIDWYDEGYYKKGYHYKKGEIHLNGAQALGYVRMRHLDPEGDFGRNKRQRKVIEALIQKATSITSVTKFTSILNTLGDNVKTNMTFNDMLTIEKNYRNAANKITQYEVKGTNTTINGVYYLSVSDAEKEKVAQMLRQNLSNN
ncbi:LCP family glycopolymer transferase [Heyndrickxia coagulans]|uniref:LCP family protein n=1 Tax=Heyndrickxia coagulans TaxID=1398 RepID=A0AAW7CEX0_HEYCO|nr:LCP family protein [Heyndrickxia coagulans]MDL5042049.1 LCP family protein [Heyndrickxia coagulans]